MRTWSRQFCPERKTETQREREKKALQTPPKKRGPCSLGFQKRYGLSSWIAFGLDTLWSLSLVENRNDIDSTRATTTSETNARRTIFVLFLERVRLFFVLVRRRGGGHRLRRFPRRLDGFHPQTQTMSMMPFRHWTILLRSRQRRLSRADRARRGERHGSVDFSFFKQPLAFPWGLFFVCALVFSRGSRLG